MSQSCREHRRSRASGTRQWKYYGSLAHAAGQGANAGALPKPAGLSKAPGYSLSGPLPSHTHRTSQGSAFCSKLLMRLPMESRLRNSPYPSQEAPQAGDAGWSRRFLSPECFHVRSLPFLCILRLIPHLLRLRGFPPWHIPRMSCSVWAVATKALAHLSWPV